MHEDMQLVTTSWIEGKKRKRGAKETDGSIIYYHGSAIARRNGDGTFAINTCGYSTVRATRDFINLILSAIYGMEAPRLVQRSNVVYMYHPTADNIIDAWVEWSEKINGDGWYTFTDKEEYLVGL
jgi:hypothetical protein